MAILFQFGVGLLDYFGQFEVYFALGLFAGVDGVVLQVYVLEQFDRVEMLDLLFAADGVALKVDWSESGVEHDFGDVLNLIKRHIQVLNGRERG